MCKKNFQIELLLDGYKEWENVHVVHLFSPSPEIDNNNFGICKYTIQANLDPRTICFKTFTRK